MNEYYRCGPSFLALPKWVGGSDRPASEPWPSKRNKTSKGATLGFAVAAGWQRLNKVRALLPVFFRLGCREFRPGSLLAFQSDSTGRPHQPNKTIHFRFPPTKNLGGLFLYLKVKIYLDITTRISGLHCMKRSRFQACTRTQKMALPSFLSKFKPGRVCCKTRSLQSS